MQPPNPGRGSPGNDNSNALIGQEILPAMTRYLDLKFIWLTQGWLIASMHAVMYYVGPFLHWKTYSPPAAGSPDHRQLYYLFSLKIALIHVHKLSIQELVDVVTVNARSYI